MRIINIQEAKTNLSRITDEVASGEEVIIAKAGKPVARLMPYVKPARDRKGGQLPPMAIPIDFDEPDEAINRLFGLE